MAVKKVRKANGNTVLVETGKVGKGIVGNLGNDVARNGIQAPGAVPGAR